MVFLPIKIVLGFCILNTGILCLGKIKMSMKNCLLQNRASKLVLLLQASNRLPHSENILLRNQVVNILV
jgi:Mg2+/Co2+ transporter CorB